MPGPGGRNPTAIDPATGLIDSAQAIAQRYGMAYDDEAESVKNNQADWISWQRRKDPITDSTTWFDGAQITCANQNITYSALTPYLNAKVIFTGSGAGTYDRANNANATLDAIYRCPSDNLQQRPSSNDPSTGYYRYSYSMNTAYSNPVTTFSNQSGSSVNFARGQRADGTFTGKLSSIRNSGQKVLLICEDEKTVNDGAFDPNPYNWNVTGSDANISSLVAARHDKRNARATSKTSSGGSNTQGNEDARGNVGFCDGHAEYFSRKDTLRGKYTGNPNPDPPGF
jgi:prepilin-type processing-associated H-X9-DG protein